MSNKITVKEHNGYYLANDGGERTYRSINGVVWDTPTGPVAPAYNDCLRKAFYAYLDSQRTAEPVRWNVKAGDYFPPEPEVFAGDPSEWEQGLYQSTQDSRFYILRDRTSGDGWVRLWINPEDTEDPMFVYRGTSNQNTYHKVADCTADLIAAKWKGGA